MNDFINKLIVSLEPTILDLDEKLNLLEEEKKNLNELTSLLAEVGNDVEKVGKYPNQELIISRLDLIKSNEKEYKACCYLLNSEDKSVRSLPQYTEASNYIERFINVLRKREEELKLELSDLETVCNSKRLNKKYLEVFKNDNPIIYDPEEFENFIKNQELSNDEKVDILLYTITNSVNGYKKGRV